MVVEPGDTVIELPEPAPAPPQLPEYHCHEAPVPREPPTTLNVVELPAHTGFTVADMLVGSVDAVL